MVVINNTFSLILSIKNYREGEKLAFIFFSAARRTISTNSIYFEAAELSKEENLLLKYLATAFVITISTLSETGTKVLLK